VPKSPNQPSSGPKPLFHFQATDDGEVLFLPPASGQAQGDVAFVEHGYMPVEINTFTVKNSSISLPSGLDGVFIHYYDGYGVQHMNTDKSSPTYGLPLSADYTTQPGQTLHYDLVGYKGTPQFSLDSGPNGEVTGVQTFLLAQGDLISGHLDFTAGITGDLKTTMQVNGKVAGELDFHVTHTGFTGPDADAQFLSAPGIPVPIGVALTGGTTTASFYPVHG
jgi:hypothetical protein